MRFLVFIVFGILFFIVCLVGVCINIMCIRDFFDRLKIIGFLYYVVLNVVCQFLLFWFEKVWVFSYFLDILIVFIY